MYLGIQQSKRKMKRNQFIALSFFIFGILLLFLKLEYIIWILERLLQASIVLKGVSFVLLSIAAILASISYSKRNVSIISGIGLILGFCFLFLPVPSLLKSTAFHLLFASSIAFGMSTSATRIIRNQRAP